jgi:hypothetical protein
MDVDMGVRKGKKENQTEDIWHMQQYMERQGSQVVQIMALCWRSG